MQRLDFWDFGRALSIIFWPKMADYITLRSILKNGRLLSKSKRWKNEPRKRLEYHREVLVAVANV